MKFPRSSHFALAFVLVGTAWLVGCSSGDSTPPTANIPPPENATPVESEDLLVSTNVNKVSILEEEFEGVEFPEVILSTTHGEIHLRLDAKKAPATVDNFLTNYVETDHYNGTVFHYVSPDSMILGGLFDKTMTPKPTRTEIRNEATNGMKNVRGTVAMSRDPNFIHSSTCQFFINCGDNPTLDHLNTEDSSSYGYCVFGEVIQGMDVVEAISKVECNATNSPSTPVEIVKAERIK